MPAEFERVQNAIKRATNNSDFLAIAFDGWAAVKGSRNIDVLVHTPRPYLFKSIDATQIAYDATFIFETLSKEVETLGPQKVVAVTTDDTPNMKAAWRLLEKRYPWIILESCKARRIDLAARDLCKLDFVSDVIEKCMDIAKFFRKTIPQGVLEETQRSTHGHSHLIQLPVPNRWFSRWTLVNSINANKSCLKIAIWSPKITDNMELKKDPARLKKLKSLLSENNNFWTNVALVEELLRPLKNAILAIEGSVVEVRTSYRIIESAFDKALEVARKLDSANKAEEVCLEYNLN